MKRCGRAGKGGGGGSEMLQGWWVKLAAATMDPVLQSVQLALVHVSIFNHPLLLLLLLLFLCV